MKADKRARGQTRPAQGRGKRQLSISSVKSFSSKTALGPVRSWGQQRQRLAQVFDGVAALLGKALAVQTLKEGVLDAAHGNHVVTVRRGRPAELPVGGILVFAQLHHAGRDEDAPAALQAAKDAQGLGGPFGVGVVGIVNDNHAAVVFELQAVGHGLQAAQRRRDAGGGDAQMQRQRRRARDVEHVVAAQQRVVRRRGSRPLQCSVKEVPCSLTEMSSL